MNNLNSPFAHDGDNTASAKERSLITIVNDDVNDGRVKLSVCKVAIFNLCPIIPGKYVRLNDTVACLLRNAYNWDEEGTCSILFDSIVKNIEEVCDVDPSKLCANVTTPADQPDYYEPLARLTCYGQHYFAEGVSCQSYLDQLIANVIPCASEAEKYCPDVSSDEKMICLSDTLSDEDITDFTAGCKSLVGTWSAENNSTYNNLLRKYRIRRDKNVSKYILSDDDASIAWSQAVKVALGVSLFIVLTIIYVSKRMCFSSHSRTHAPGDSIEKYSRGSYVQMPTVPEEWDETCDQDEGVAL